MPVVAEAEPEGATKSRLKAGESLEEGGGEP